MKISKIFFFLNSLLFINLLIRYLGEGAEGGNDTGTYLSEKVKSSKIRGNKGKYSVSWIDKQSDYCSPFNFINKMNQLLIHTAFAKYMKTPQDLREDMLKEEDELKDEIAKTLKDFYEIESVHHVQYVFYLLKYQIKRKSVETSYNNTTNNETKLFQLMDAHMARSRENWKQLVDKVKSKCDKINWPRNISEMNKEKILNKLFDILVFEWIIIESSIILNFHIMREKPSKLNIAENYFEMLIQSWNRTSQNLLKEVKKYIKHSISK